MAWTAPKTWSSGDVLTAADMNTYVRDNTNETAPGKAAAAGDLFYATSSTAITPLTKGTTSSLLVQGGSNAPVWRLPAEDTLDESTTFTDTGFTDLDGLSPAAFSRGVSVTATTGTIALVIISGKVSNDTAGSRTQLAYRVSGATTIASTVDAMLSYDSSVADDEMMGSFGHVQDGLTAGSNTFELQTRCSANNGTLTDPRIAVVPF